MASPRRRAGKMDGSVKGIGGAIGGWPDNGGFGDNKNCKPQGEDGGNGNDGQSGYPGEVIISW